MDPREGIKRVRIRHLLSKSREYHIQIIQPTLYVVIEVPSQFSMGQTVQSLTCSLMEKPHTGLDD